MNCHLENCSIITNAAGFRVVQDETLVAGAHEAAKGVGAVAILTDVLVLVALVDVFQDYSDLIGSVSKPTRAQFFEFLGSRLRTLFATIAPSVTDAAATCRLGH